MELVGRDLVPHERSSLAEVAEACREEGSFRSTRIKTAEGGGEGASHGIQRGQIRRMKYKHKDLAQKMRWMRALEY